MFSVATFLREDFNAQRTAEVHEIVFGDTLHTSVVELDDRVVGFTAVDDDGTPCITDIWVSPQAWGSGVAPALVAAAEDERRNVGITRMTTWVPEDSPRARALFDKAGWNPTGAIDRGGVPRKSRTACSSTTA